MSTELEGRKKHALAGINKLLADIDPSLKVLYQSLLDQDSPEDLNDEQQVSRLEGFHDYIVVRERTGAEYPSLAEFIEVRNNVPDELLSFGTGRHRHVLEGDDVVIHDIAHGEVEQGDIDPVLEEEIVEFENEGGHLPRVVISPSSAASPDPIDDDEVPEFLKDDYDDSTPEEKVESGKKVNSGSPFTDTNEVVNIEANDEKEPEVKASEKEQDTPGHLNAKAIHEYKLTTKRGGYNDEQVDNFLDKAASFLEDKTLTPEDFKKKAEEVRSTKFKSSKMRQGYNQLEVDGLMTAIASEMDNRSL